MVPLAIFLATLVIECWDGVVTENLSALSSLVGAEKMVQIGRRSAAAPKKAKKASTFVIDCSKPVEDQIMEIAVFEKFLVDKIKVEGKTGTHFEEHDVKWNANHIFVEGDGSAVSAQNVLDFFIVVLLICPR